MADGRKLELHKETLRWLNDIDLAEVAGGGADTVGTGCTDSIRPYGCAPSNPWGGPCVLTSMTTGTWTTGITSIFPPG